MNLKPVSFNWKEGQQETKLGFIAQDTLKVIPEVVQTDNPQQYGMSYSELIPVLTRAVQEQQEMIKKQGEEIEDLKKMIK
jgi:hypothetical protein